jgi:predicted transporter
MNQMKMLVRSRSARICAVLSAVVSAAVVSATAASAACTAGDKICETFASTQTSLLTQMGYGVALVVALLLLGIGIRMLVKWAKMGVSKS